MMGLNIMLLTVVTRAIITAYHFNHRNLIYFVIYTDHYLPEIHETMPENSTVGN